MGANSEPDFVKAHSESDRAVQDPLAIVQPFMNVWRQVVLSPKEFMMNFPLDEPIVEPVKFYSGIIAVNVGFTLLLGSFHPATLITNVLVCLAVNVLSIVVSCALLRLISGMFGGTGSFLDLFRALCYANAPNVMVWIPIIGFFPWIYSIFLSKLAVERIEGLEAARAKAVVLIAAAISGAAFLTVLFLGTALLFRPVAGT
jgi:hypothetical protein